MVLGGVEGVRHRISPLMIAMQPLSIKLSINTYCMRPHQAAQYLESGC